VSAALQSAKDKLTKARERLKRTSIVNIECGRQAILIHSLYTFADALEVTPAQLFPPKPKR
jgi:hypothetical protein